MTAVGVMNMYITSTESDSGIGTRASECNRTLEKSYHHMSA